MRLPSSSPWCAAFLFSFRGYNYTRHLNSIIWFNTLKILEVLAREVIKYSYLSILPLWFITLFSLLCVGLSRFILEILLLTSCWLLTYSKEHKGKKNVAWKLSVKLKLQITCLCAESWRLHQHCLILLWHWSLMNINYLLCIPVGVEKL